MSRILSPIGGAGGGVDPVSQSNLVRYAKGQPTLIDPNSQVASWSYDEDTGTLSVETAANIPTQGAYNAPHFIWPATGLDGVDITPDGLGDMFFICYPLITDVVANVSPGDDPSIAVGLTNDNTALVDGFSAIWNPNGASSAFWNTPPGTGYGGLDTAPSGSPIGVFLSYTLRSVYTANATDPENMRASAILPAGDYDSGLESTISGFLPYFRSSNLYLDVWFGAREYSGGSGGLITAGSTFTLTVAQITTPLMPRFLGSNFVKPA